jgi:hypothetical protein
MNESGEKEMDNYFSPIKIQIAQEMEQFNTMQEEEYKNYVLTCDRIMTGLQIIFQRGGKERENIIKVMDQFWAKFKVLLVDINKELEKVFT